MVKCLSSLLTLSLVLASCGPQTTPDTQSGSATTTTATPTPPNATPVDPTVELAAANARMLESIKKIKKGASYADVVSAVGTPRTVSDGKFKSYKRESEPYKEPSPMGPIVFSWLVQGPLNKGNKFYMVHFQDGKAEQAKVYGVDGTTETLELEP